MVRRFIISLGLMIFFLVMTGMGCDSTSVASFVPLKNSVDSTSAQQPPGALKTEDVVSESPVTSNSTDSEKGENGNKKITTTLVYKNTYLGFQITLPAGWYVPSETNPNPHFYNCPNYDCAEAFEVQGVVEWKKRNPRFEPPSYKERGVTIREEGRDVYTSKNIIPGIAIIKTPATGAAVGWEWEYNIFYNENHQDCLIFTKGKNIEKTILSTFKHSAS
jgi:hypothetical protein